MKLPSILRPEISSVRQGEATSTTAMLVLLALATLVPVSGLVNDVGLQLAFNIVFYASLALGLNLVVGFAGLLNIGYIAFFGIGAYIYAMLASPHFGLHLPIIIVIPIAAFVSVVFGLLFALPTLRLRGDYLAVVTLGFGAIVELVANNAVPLTNGPNGIFGIDPAEIFGLRFTDMVGYYYLMLVAAATMVFLTLRLGGSRIGRSWAAIREDEAAARASGIDTVRLKLLAFTLSAAAAGAVGPIFAASQGYIGPMQLTLDASVLVLTIVIVGGTGSVRGAILGAVLLILIPEVLRDLAGARFIVVGATMVLVMIVRPQGLIPPTARPLGDLRAWIGMHRRRSADA